VTEPFNYSFFKETAYWKCNHSYSISFHPLNFETWSGTRGMPQNTLMCDLKRSQHQHNYVCTEQTKLAN
jgi:hypothetical protein